MLSCKSLFVRSCSRLLPVLGEMWGVDQDAHLAEHKIQLAGHSILPSCPSLSLFLVFFIKVKLRSMHLGDMRGRLIGSSFP